jgi:hypothetical protein
VLPRLGRPAFGASLPPQRQLARRIHDGRRWRHR